MRTPVIVLAALVIAVPAAAGGFATVGVEPLPDGDSAVWTPTLTVKAHGRTPVDDARPLVIIENAATGQTHTFRALPTGSPGRYRVTVEFPRPGTWEYRVDDGSTGQVHTFAPVEIRAGAAPAPASAAPAPAGAGSPWPLGAAAVGLVAAAALLLLLRRRGRPAAPVAAARR